MDSCLGSRMTPITIRFAELRQQVTPLTAYLETCLAAPTSSRHVAQRAPAVSSMWASAITIVANSQYLIVIVSFEFGFGVGIAFVVAKILVVEHGNHRYEWLTAP